MPRPVGLNQLQDKNCADQGTKVERTCRAPDTAVDLAAGPTRRKPRRNGGIAAGEGVGVITSLGSDTEAGVRTDEDGAEKGVRVGGPVRDGDSGLGAGGT